MGTYRILVPLDGSAFSRQALDHVRRLFSPTDYEVILFRAAEEPAGVVAAPPRDVLVGGKLMSMYQSVLDAERAQHPIFASQAWETTVAALKDELHADARILRDAGFKVSADVRFGDPAEEIVACVEDQGIDFVVMATHGRTGGCAAPARRHCRAGAAQPPGCRDAGTAGLTFVPQRRLVGDAVHAPNYFRGAAIISLAAPRRSWSSGLRLSRCGLTFLALSRLGPTYSAGGL